MVLNKNIYLNNLVSDLNLSRLEIGWIMEHRMLYVRFDLITFKTNIKIVYYFLNYVLAGSVHSVAEALLILLDSTSEPIIPYNLHATCLSAVSYYSQCKQVSIILLLKYKLFLTF